MSPTTDTRGEKLAQRLSGILARLHQGEARDKHQLVQQFGADVRTIERDLNQRLEGISERNTDGLWQLAQAWRCTDPASRLHDYARVTGTERFFPDTSLSYLLKQLQAPEPRHTTHVQPTPQEDLGAKGQHFAQLQMAIEQHCESNFTYKGKPRQAQPYRLIHKTGVWYLAAEEAGLLKSFSVRLIQALQVDEAKRFARKRTHQDYINAKDDVWFTDGSDVLLRVAPEIAHYFARRPLLPQQQQRADSDGSLLVTTHINHINQLLPVVRYWLPNVRIISPVDCHEALMEWLRQALAQWGSEHP